MSNRSAPYRHADGTDCYTKDCSLGHVSSVHQAVLDRNVSAYLTARAAEDKSAQRVNTFRSLEYGTPLYKTFVEQSSALSSQATGKEVQAVVEYTGWAYQQYYSFFEGKNSDGSVFGSQYDESTRERLGKALNHGASQIDSFIAKGGKFKKPVQVFRGESVPAGKTLEQHLNETYPVGKSVNVKRFLSTSLDPKIASDITGSNESYVVVITTREGAMLDESTSEHGLREKEVLLPRNRDYRVERVSRDVFQWGSTKKTHTTVYLTLQ